MDEKIDRRVIKTRKAIRKAFADMLRVKSFDCITVKDISDAADISRKTFYTYYHGVWEIKNEIEKEIINLLAQDVQNNDPINYIKSPQTFFIKLNYLFGDYSDFFDAMITNSDNMYLIREMAKIVGESIKKLLKEKAEQLKVEEKKLNIIVQFIITGVFFVYQDWYESGRVEPIENVCEALGEIIFKGLNGLKEEFFI